VGNFVNGNLVRSEATNHHYGYWASGGRTFFVGQPTSVIKQAYANNIALKQLAVRLLCPGAISSDIYRAVVEQAARTGVDLWGEPGIGHGVGTSEREAPFICSQDKTVLQAGMVVTLAIYTRGPSGELIVSKDTYKIVDDGSEPVELVPQLGCIHVSARGQYSPPWLGAEENDMTELGVS
jgi:Xaa-Pro dipeptidase